MVAFTWFGNSIEVFKAIFGHLLAFGHSLSVFRNKGYERVDERRGGREEGWKREGVGQRRRMKERRRMKKKG